MHFHYQAQMTFYSEEIAAYSSLSDGSWLVPTIWEYEYLPGKYKKASKAPASTNKSITVRKKNKITSSSVVSDNVFIQSEGTLLVNGDITISNGGSGTDFVNEGTLIVTGKFELQGKMENKAGSLVELTGTSDQNIPGGTYAKLKLSNRGTKKLKSDISVNESLQLNSSILTTGSFTVTLSSSANIIGETGAYHILGKVKTIRSLSNNVDNFGGLGAEIDATANNEDLGNVTIIRTTGSPVVVGNSTSLSRTWSIEPEFQPKKDVKLTLNWNEADEDIPFDLAKMQVWKSIDKGKTWMTVGTVQAAAGRKITVVTPSFSDWTVSDQMNTLPVKFKSFTGAEQNNNAVSLNWTTTEELNNAGFEVQKSLDGKEFVKIGYVEGEGNSKTLSSYEFIDQNFTSKAYYRLKQIDFNGESDYSEMIFIDKKIASTSVQKSFTIYPNPVIDHVKIGSTLQDVSSIEVVVHNAKGKQVMNSEGSLDEVNGELENLINSWEPDIYIVDIKSQGKTERLKMIKK
jgi:hypothetical protein